MDYSFTKPQQELRERTAAFTAKEISRDVAREVDHRGEFPHDLMKKLGEQGFWKINIPEEYGGDGGNIVDLMIFFEEISKALPVLSWTAGDVLLYGNNILKVNGNEEQRQRYLPRLAKGELTFCFALTEPDAGSDAANIQTAAERVGDHYLINGSKMFISGASVADITVTNTRTGPDRYKGITSFLVDTSSEGYSATPIKKLGYKGSDTCEVYYKDVKVSPDSILGGEECLNQGWHQMMRLLNGERLVLSACAIGIMDTVVNECISHLRKRKKRTGAGIRFQDTEHKIAEMATQMQAARQLAFYSAWMMTQEMECIKETSMSKYFCADSGKKIALMGMEILGAEGYTMDSAVQQFFRDIPILSIGGGTSQIQKNVIAKTLGL
ncbi:MAG: acyl-CoA/acyl-ACP dehydrogenase [Deltaproteobacteria bacterium]|nr:acyl-CoA/acyl-ACP dehydrogenase [Deltaproteobacteria bacterium]MBT4641722.1 acyl-CoA/acyl-ACP dehydrogenase [Deltaproteobacteria bacterium]MBT7151554.1 acyl-CoA/acyl-ACP dehydrogenase [Deltaproteobacteria bacterium]MBT7713665.1 acyl-CoA/acyl-ACP dehydrogenase [Deltaproteobacteria bacterium]MBT7890404.1 acyl-CoA/acyl-ACP dehydrogenase [Deltaproteobacteria bacterium]